MNRTKVLHFKRVMHNEMYNAEFKYETKRKIKQIALLKEKTT